MNSKKAKAIRREVRQIFSDLRNTYKDEMNLRGIIVKPEKKLMRGDFFKRHYRLAKKIASGKVKV